MRPRILTLPGGAGARFLALGVLAAAATVAAIAAGLPVLDLAVQRHVRLQHLEAELRLREAEAASLPALRAALTRRSAVPGLLAGRDADEAADDLENRVRRHALAAGVQLLSTAQAPGSPEGGLRRLVIDARFDGPYENLLRFCGSLAEDPAVLSVARLNLKPARLSALDGSRDLSVALSIAGYIQSP